MDSDNDDKVFDSDEEIDFLAFVKEMVEPETDEETAVDPLEPNEYGWTLFHAACMGGRCEAVQYLVEEHQVDVESLEDEEDRNTALHCACKGDRGDLRTVQYLVEVAKAKTDARNRHGWTPLHMACYEGHLDVVEYLIEQQQMHGQRGRGVDCNAVTCDDLTPLHCACLKMRVELIPYLAQFCTVDEKALRLSWTELLPFSSKRILLERYARTTVSEEELPSESYFGTYPMHAVLRSGLPLCSEMYHDCIVHLYPKKHLATMDETYGQLPLHVLLDVIVSMARKDDEEQHRVFLEELSSVVLAMVDMEPRAATVKNPQTGLYPFETIAGLAVVSSSSDDDDTATPGMGWFRVLHKLLSLHDPASLWNKERVMLVPTTKTEMDASLRTTKDSDGSCRNRGMSKGVLHPSLSVLDEQQQQRWKNNESTIPEVKTARGFNDDVLLWKEDDGAMILGSKGMSSSRRSRRKKKQHLGVSSIFSRLLPTRPTRRCAGCR